MRTSVILGALLAAALLRAGPEYPNRGPDIYDVKADGFALIQTARQQARAGNKRVLLDFGANWCPWCHALHRLFTTDDRVRDRLAADYVVVMIDVNQRHGTARNAAVNEKYGNPVKEGLPVLVVLDDDGHRLVTQETGALEQGGGSRGARPGESARLSSEMGAPARPVIFKLVSGARRPPPTGRLQVAGQFVIARRRADARHRSNRSLRQAQGPEQCRGTGSPSSFAPFDRLRASDDRRPALRAFRRRSSRAMADRRDDKAN